MENQIKINTILIEGKELSWNYTICPCLTCQLYLEKIDTVSNCMSHRCTYNKQLAKNIANDVFFIMNNRHCENCDTWCLKEDLKYSHTCPNCGCDLN